MVRGAPLLPVLLLAALAGCGGSPDPPDPSDRPPVPDRQEVSGEVRPPDARTPLVAVDAGAWRCATAARFELSISAEGQATLSSGRTPLASLAPTRTLINRRCDRLPRGRGGAHPTAGARGGRLGASLVRCRAPAAVLVDFGGGDLTVRDGRGAFLAGAAVSPDRSGVAGYWGAGCAPV